jgi:hypothetical protein
MSMATRIMSVHVIDLGVPVPDRQRPVNNERRKNPRVPLHWTLYLVCNGSQHPVRATTRDINQDGFYCLLSQAIKPGEQIDCDIVVPAHRSQNPDDVLYLRCRAKAVRVEKIGGGPDFGLACQFQDYRVVRGVAEPLARLPEELRGTPP